MYSTIIDNNKDICSTLLSHTMIESSHFFIYFFIQIIISDVVKNGEGGHVLGEGEGEFNEATIDLIHH